MAWGLATPISLLALRRRWPAWAVKADSPFKTVQDVIAAAKKTPESVTVTAYGAGSDDHLAILGISAETGTRFVVVHSRSTAEAKTQALGSTKRLMGW